MSAYSSYATTTGDFFTHQNSINQTQQHQIPTQDPMIFHPAPTYYANTQDLIGYPPPQTHQDHTSTGFHYYQPIAPAPWPDTHFDVNYVNHSFDYAGLGASGLKNWSTDTFSTASLLTTTNPTEMLMNFSQIPTNTENSTILGQMLERQELSNPFGGQEKTNHPSNHQNQSTSPSNIPISTTLNSLSTNSQLSGKNHEKQQLNRQRTLNARQLQIQNPTAKVFTCTQCNRQYCRKSTLKAHMKQHTGSERQFVCECCGKTFTQAANLTAHQRVHTGEKPFACSICLRPFSQSSSLVTHRRTHSGERPYPCPHCVKSFTDSSTLTKHMRTHSGIKPYSCHLCMMRFSQSGNLHRHMKTHRGYVEEN